jgi:putative chitinase
LLNILETIMIDREHFFTTVRTGLFHGSLSTSQVDGMNIILDAYEARKVPRYFQAYPLATTYHETEFTMQPIDENGSDAYFEKNYGPAGRNPKRAREYGNIHIGDGAKYHGRGFVQCTWFVNYNRATKELGVDFVNHPDLAKEPQHAADIMILGMTEGWFTGKKLENYFTATSERPVEARWIINGTDKANEIAGYYRVFKKALIDA